MRTVAKPAATSQPPIEYDLATTGRVVKQTNASQCKYSEEGTWRRRKLMNLRVDNSLTYIMPSHRRPLRTSLRTLRFRPAPCWLALHEFAIIQE
jgi:hypothetical protein